jgi:hypothetical protein
MLLAIQSFNDCTDFSFKASYFDSKMTVFSNENKDKTVHICYISFFVPILHIFRQIFRM